MQDLMNEIELKNRDICFRDTEIERLNIVLKTEQVKILA